MKLGNNASFELVLGFSYPKLNFSRVACKFSVPQALAPGFC